MEGEILNPSMVHNTVEAYEIVCRMDHAGKIDDSLLGKKQKAATALLRDEIRKQDFAKPIALRVSRVLGPVSRFRIAQILPQMSPLLVSCASSAIFVRHTDFTLRERNKCVELDAWMNPTLSLSHYKECPLLYIFASVWDKLLCCHGEAIFSTT